jgi:hypothetical protein
MLRIKARGQKNILNSMMLNKEMQPALYNVLGVADSMGI